MLDTELEIRKGGGGGSENFFFAVWSKNNREAGPLGPSPVSTTDYCLTRTSVGCTAHK